MKKSQLNAINYSYSRKSTREAEQVAKEKQIDMLFGYQTRYKTLRGFVEAYGKAPFAKAVEEAAQKLSERKTTLEACNCTSYKYDECLEAIEQIRRVKESTSKAE